MQEHLPLAPMVTLDKRASAESRKAIEDDIEVAIGRDHMIEVMMVIEEVAGGMEMVGRVGVM